MVKPCAYEVQKEGDKTIIRFNWLGCPYKPSIEGDPECMSRVIDAILQVREVSRVVVAEAYEYEYSEEQTAILVELASTIDVLLREENVLTKSKIVIPECDKCYPERFRLVEDLLITKMRKDPIAAYLQVIFELGEFKTKIETLRFEKCKKCYKLFVDNVLRVIKKYLEKTTLIKRILPKIDKIRPGDRFIYEEIFSPLIRPNFTLTRYMMKPPSEGELLDSYTILGNVEVEIYAIPGKTEKYYHIIPPEFKLPEDQYLALGLARRVMLGYKPTTTTFTERTREYFERVGEDLIATVASEQNIALKHKNIRELAKILTRYTTGLGIIEVLLADPGIQDLYINAPIGELPIRLLHSQYEECVTNLIPTKEDAESMAARFRLQSGRPLDEAEPVLDTSATVPGGRARVCVVTRSLSPRGLAFAFRRHRSKPWTYPLFIDNKTMSAMAAGLLWFVVDGGRVLLFAGPRSSGKTSILAATIGEIMKKYRILTVEDSVVGDSKIIIERNGKIEKTKAGELIDKLVENYGENKLGRDIVEINPENIKVHAIDKHGKQQLAKVKKFIRHKVDKNIYKVRTSTGRVIEVTEDHSLFTIGKNDILKPIKIKELKKGDYLAVPRSIPFSSKTVESIDLLEYLNKLDKTYFVGATLKRLLDENRSIVKDIGKRLEYHRTSTARWIRDGIIPVEVLKELHRNGLEVPSKNLYIKYKNSKRIPATVPLTKDFLTFVGLWLADGCYDKKSIIISASETEEREVVKKVGEQFNIPLKIHSDGFAVMLNSSILRKIMRDVLELKGSAFTKTLPNWIYNLSKEQIACVLRGLFSGDGCATDKEVVIGLASRELLYDIQTLLLSFGSVLRIGKLRNDNTYNSRISNIKSLKPFKEWIGFLQKGKQEKLVELCSKVSTHDSSDIIPLPLEVKKEIAEICPKFNVQDYIKRNNNIGREHLRGLISEIPYSENPTKNLELLANSDILWDKIVSVELSKTSGYVYDFCVEGHENFVCENILAHNTLELPIEAYREVGYNILSMKVQSVITKLEAEIPADEGIRTALRLGDSCLIIGEVRSSVRGDEEVVIVENGETKRVPIKSMKKEDIKNIKVPTLDKNLNISLTKLTDFVKHPSRKKLIEIVTKTGRKVTVTPDHSVFTATDFVTHPISTNLLNKGDKILIPGSMPCGYNDVEFLNLMDILSEFRVENAEKYIRKAISKLGWKKASKVCGVKDIYKYLLRTQKTNIPIKSFKKLMKEANIEYLLNDLSIKRGTSSTLPAKLPVTEDFCRFLGYYVAEGYVSSRKKKGSEQTSTVTITNSKEEIIRDVVSISEKLFNVSPKLRQVTGLGKSKQMRIDSSLLVELILRVGCGRTCGEKRIPAFIYGLSKEKVCAFLRGAYSGDGTFTASKKSGNRVAYATTSEKLAEDVMYLLLTLGIVARVYKRSPRGKGKRVLYLVEFKQEKFVKTFLEQVGFTHKTPKMIKKAFAHTTENSVSFDPKELEKHLKLPRKYRHLRRHHCCSKDYLKRITKEEKCSKELSKFANGEFYLDEIKEINEINLTQPEPVYDLSVNPTENFIGGFGGVILHNTEARALYEAMRVGALSNIVAGTIHGDNPYGVWDRVVNDLGVPTTSFKATDFLVMPAPIRSADGLHRYRRVVTITEVGKTWTEDPLKEGGFTELMKYDAKKDSLLPTDEFLNGKSEILNAIASRVKEWVGDWDAVLENIKLRADIKQGIVDLAKRSNNRELLEAEFNGESNSQFHLISEKVQRELGAYDSKEILKRWNEWAKKAAREKAKKTT